MRIEYTSDNGFSGVLYGTSSMVILNPEGKVILHTGFRTPNTLEELKPIVDTMPEFMERFLKIPEVQNERTEQKPDGRDGSSGLEH